MAQITLRDYLQETEDAIGSKQIDKALANCQSILTYFPDSLEVQRLLGEVYLAQGRLEDARHSFDWVLSNDPENVITYCSRALVSKNMSDYDTALDCYQQAYELSRGNSQIRQAFNELSEQVGLQGFMLSRAGLARLYMRGDLLAQAIQEWDVVLAATPDRLDARTGLLEAYWREGLYEQASQLANQILRDVPGCVKALVLQAHVTAPQDMLQSQELIQRVEALDPDLIMAHDLFADHLASQSRDPFLKLLRKPPVMLGEEAVRKGAPVSVDTPTLQTANFSFASTATSAPSSDALATWGKNEADQYALPSLVAWNADSPIENHAGSSATPLQNSGSGSLWGGTDVTYSASWGAFQGDMQPLSSEDDGGQPEPWQLLQNALNNISPEATLSQPQQSLSQLEALYDDNAKTLSAQPTQESREYVEEVNARIPDEMQSVDSPLFPILQENNSSAPPVWLNVLAQTERNQLSGGIPAIHSDEQREQRRVSQPLTPPMPQVEREPVNDKRANWTPATNAANARKGEEEEEESFFGPNWLKSLGAASLESDQIEEVAMSVPPIQAPPEISKMVEAQEEVHETWRSQPEQRQSEVTNDSWAAGSFQNLQEQPMSGTWLDALSSSPQYEQSEPAHQPWEHNLTAGSQPEVEYKLEHNDWGASQYEVNPQQNGEYSYSLEPEAEELQGASWSAHIAQPQEQPKRGTWLDALGSLPQYEQHESVYQPVEDSSTAGLQPEIEQEEKEHLVGQAWDSHWSEAEKGQPSWLSQMSGPQTQAADETWQPLPVETQPQSNEESEANLVTTLEELEQKLLSRGFIPLEPNSLSTIAQAQSTSPSSEELAHSVMYDTQDHRQEPSLSSALAELGSFIQPAASNEPIATPAQPAIVPEQPAADPSWLASLRAVPAAVPMSSMPEVVAQSMPREEIGPAVRNTRSYQQEAKPEVKPAANVPQEPKVKPPVRAEAVFSPSFEATDPSTAKSQPDILQGAAVRMNPLLDSELETTMKRPAVRLQPMQKRAVREVSPQNRGQVAEQVTLSPGNGNAGYRERLLRGYQSQLIGDYDGAMQEYRIIIRNTPELLGEVVSNLRALLKLAPKYSVGYRVLGDAYMRQGEYLQAMEAYNKALTMAKKAKN